MFHSFLPLQRSIFFVLALGITSFYGCKPPKDPVPQPEAKGSIKLDFNLVSRGKPYALGELDTTIAGEPFRINLLSYYLSNFALKKTDGTIVSIPDSYHLIDVGTKDSVLLSAVPAGQYSEIMFLMGVDSAKTTSGAHTGDLDPLKGMFWSMWGIYINFMLEGTSPSSKAQGQLFKYHVAGYEQPYSTLQKVTLPSPSSLNIQENNTPKVEIDADIQKFFNGPTPISIARLSFYENTGDTAKRLSDNYKNMFTITSVTP